MTVRRTFITQIPPGSPIPNGAPRRYKNRDGYVRLRWYVSTYTYVECYEHRVVDGHVVNAEYERHHVNRVRDDNHPDNLVSLAPADHDALHHHCAVLDDIVRLYQEGKPTTEVARLVGRDNSVVYRHLVAAGVPIRRPQSYLPTIDPDQLREWHRQGVRTMEMARRFGRTPRAVKAVMNDLGLPPFRPGRP